MILSIPAVDDYQFRAAFKLIVSDFFEVLAFVEPTDQNKNVFSHRIYELLLRSCTEFESISKCALSSVHIKAHNISEYAELESILGLARFELGFHLWQPKPTYCAPLASWGKLPRATPSWYRSYNLVKHNRRENFQEASLYNLLQAIGSVHILLAQLNASAYPQDDVVPDDITGMDEIFFTACPFSMRFRKQA